MSNDYIKWNKQNQQKVSDMLTKKDVEEKNLQKGVNTDIDLQANLFSESKISDIATETAMPTSETEIDYTKLESTLEQEPITPYYTADMASSKGLSEVQINEELPDTKSEESVMKFFGLYYESMGNLYGVIMRNIDDYTFVKDKNGNITDVYPKNQNNKDYVGDRFSIRYDKDGNITKTFVQNIDEKGNVTGQEITNYNADGTKKNMQYCTYEYDENGKVVSQNSVVVDAKYGDVGNIQELATYFGVDISKLNTGAAFPVTDSRYNSAIGNAEYMNNGCENVKRTSDGKISEFTLNGQRYMLRYDSSGNLSKIISQSFGSNKNVKVEQTDEFVNTQHVVEFGSDGKVQKDTTYAYYEDENGKRQQITKNNLYGEEEDAKLTQNKESIKKQIEMIERNIEQIKPNISQSMNKSLAVAKAQLGAISRLLMEDVVIAEKSLDANLFSSEE